MKIVINWRDNEAPKTYANVDSIKMVNPGCYVLANTNGEVIAHIPLDVVRSVEMPENDTPIVKVTV